MYPNIIGKEQRERRNYHRTVKCQSAWLACSPRLGEGALQDQGSMGNTLRANVAEELADTWVAAHLKKKQKE